MAKTFNITGTCIPERHYMADISKKLADITGMVSRGDYFTINRPRQYGKTTVIYLLEQQLKKDKDYLAIDISFEGIDTPTYEKHDRFIRTVLDILGRRLKFMRENELAAMIEADKSIFGFEELGALLTELVVKSGRKVVLLIDEVDKAGNTQLFLDFLGMLRTKYLKQKEGKDYFFHSVILAGVHDVKTLKAKIRRGGETMFNSPWNIAVNFDVELSLLPDEIASMLTEYSNEQQVKMDIPFLADQLFYYTSGYPFLVSYLCKIIHEEILPAKKKHPEWKADDLDEAVQIALAGDNTNFRSLIKNLELYEFVYTIIMNEKEFSFNTYNPLIDFGVIYGIFKKDKGKTRIHNRIYEQRIFNYMSSKLETSGFGDIQPLDRPGQNRFSRRIQGINTFYNL